MPTLFDLKEAAQRTATLETISEYRDALIYEIESGRNHIENIHETVSDSHPKKQDTLSSCNHTLSTLENELTKVNSQISLMMFDRAVSDHIVPRKNRKLVWVVIISIVLATAVFIW